MGTLTLMVMENHGTVGCHEHLHGTSSASFIAIIYFVLIMFFFLFIYLFLVFFLSFADEHPVRGLVTEFHS